ncbi:uncharacterized protein [Rhodnius prolixus]|uniref:Uncharacterized protein n=1 Tax=Rhodnius prolixus TaxID=13249 RepID=T1HRB9_RHOPR
MDKTMSVQFVTVVFTCLLVGLLAETVKVINSTDINNITLPLPPEDKSGSVQYVYPTVGEEEEFKNLTIICYVKINENGKDVTLFNQTRAEVEKLGKIVLEEHCTYAEDDMRKIGPGLIASLGG